MGWILDKIAACITERSKCFVAGVAAGSVKG